MTRLIFGFLSRWTRSTKDNKNKQANDSAFSLNLNTRHDSAMGSAFARLENESTDKFAPTAVPGGEDIQPSSSSVKSSISRKSSRRKDSGGVAPLPSPPTASDQLSAPASPTPETKAVLAADIELPLDVGSAPFGNTTPVEATSPSTTALHHPISHDELERGSPTGPTSPISSISLYEQLVIDISQPVDPLAPLHHPSHGPSGKDSAESVAGSSAPGSSGPSHSSGTLLNSARPEPSLEQPSQDEGKQGQAYDHLSETGAEDNTDQEEGHLQLPTSAGASARPSTPELSRSRPQSPGNAICKLRIIPPLIRVDQEEHSDCETGSRTYFSALSSIRSTASSFVGLHPFTFPALSRRIRTVSVALPPPMVQKVLSPRVRALSSQGMATSPRGLSTTPSLPASSFSHDTTSRLSIPSHIQPSSHRNPFEGRQSTRPSLGERRGPLKDNHLSPGIQRPTSAHSHTHRHSLTQVNNSPSRRSSSRDRMSRGRPVSDSGLPGESTGSKGEDEDRKSAEHELGSGEGNMIYTRLEEEHDIPSDSKGDKTAPQAVPDTRPPSELPPKQMSSKDTLQCLLNHGCVDLSSNMDSSQYSAGLVVGGAFGDIWKGKLLDGTEVAIKVWRFCSILQDGPKPMKRAMREIYNWSKADHENIQRLMGVVLFQERLGMVSLWMKHGNLREYILKFPSVDRYSLCGQVATGVSYLHDRGMVHGDLKAANVLVSEDGVCKLSDFDHSIVSECSLAFSLTSNQGGGTTRWMAPELFREYSSRSLCTDIYALGMTMLEIVAGTLPYYPKFKLEPQVVLAVSRGELPERPTTYFGNNALGNQMWALLLCCWDREPSARPEAAKVLELMQTIASMSRV